MEKISFIRLIKYCASMVMTMIFLAAALVTISHAQAPSSIDRDRGRAMLKNLKDDIKKNYYDQKFHGIDLDARFKAADEKVQQATSNGQIMGIIAQVLLDFNDSHLFFLPPPRTARTEYGWLMKIMGNKCFVTAVKPGSDAETKGVKAGDEVLAINGYAPTRDDFWKMEYAYNVLRPQPALRLELKSPEGQLRTVDVLAKIEQGKQVIDYRDDTLIFDFIKQSANAKLRNRHTFIEYGEDLTIWKMPNFNLDEEEVDKAMNTVKKRKALIIDMRGNPGGAVLALQRLLGYFFDHDITIGMQKGRKGEKPLIAKTMGNKVYKGDLVVLVDSDSASCAELFPRVIQLEKRGKVVGDLTSGKVMLAYTFFHQLGTDTVIRYGASVTDEDVIMADGKSIEHVGVTPDEQVLPNAADLANSQDPALAQAAKLAGRPIEPEKAGKLFPILWDK